MKAKALALPKNHFLSTKFLFFIFATLLVSTFFFYVYLVNKTVMNVVSRQKIESSISSLSTTIGTLEYKYITLKGGVTMDLAYQKGFVDASPTTFLARNSNQAALSYNSAH